MTTVNIPEGTSLSNRTFDFLCPHFSARVIGSFYLTLILSD